MAPQVMARSLRYVCHLYGAHLVYLGGLNGATYTAADSKGHKAQVDAYSRLFSHLVFTGLDHKVAFKLAPQFDHMAPLLVVAGSDAFKDIGRPKGSVTSDPVAGLQEWETLFAQVFPPTAKESKGGQFKIDDKYK